MDRDRFLTLAQRAGFNAYPADADVEAQLLLDRLESFYRVVLEDAAQAAAAVFGGDMTRITHADASTRAVMAVRSLYSDDVLFQLADPSHDPFRYLPPTRLRP